jgi:hypothetical protein
MRTITEEQFEKEFHSLLDHVPDNIDDLERDLGRSSDANHLWTYVDGDEGGQYLIAGVHWVNAWGFAVTENPHDFDVEVEIESAEDEEERYKKDRLTSAYTMRITGLDAIYGTDSYIDAFIALMADIETNNSGQIAQLQAEHPEFEVRIDLVIGGATQGQECGQDYMAGQICTLPKGHEGGHR